MLSLTVLMLFFQNCSPSGGLFTNDSSHGLIINPPLVYASRDVNCGSQATNFFPNEIINVCIQNAGTAPRFCVSNNVDCSPNEAVSTASGWSASSGIWKKTYQTQLGSFLIKAVHTDDVSAIGQYNFMVAQ